MRNIINNCVFRYLKRHILCDHRLHCNFSTRSISTSNDSDIFPSDEDDRRQLQAWARDQQKHSFRPNINPKDTSIVLFPGQGTQFVGMGKELLQYPGVNDIYEFASQKLGFNLLELCLKGPKAKLDRTVYSQPAIFVTSIAALEKLKHQNPQVVQKLQSSIISMVIF